MWGLPPEPLIHIAAHNKSGSNRRNTIQPAEVKHRLRLHHQDYPASSRAPHPLLFDDFFCAFIVEREREEGNLFPDCTDDNLWTLSMGEEQRLRSSGLFWGQEHQNIHRKKSPYRQKTSVCTGGRDDWLHQIIHNLLKHWSSVERGMLGPGQNGQQSHVAW